LPAQVALVTVYCSLFVAPLGLLLAVRRRLGESADARLATARLWLRTAAPRALAGIAGAGGTALALVGVGGLF